MKKRLRSIILIGVILSIVLSSCGASSVSSGNTSQGASEETASAGAGEKTKFKVAISSDSFITDYSYDGNYFTKYISDLNNVDLEFNIMPEDSDEVRTKISLMIASQTDMPDIFIIDGTLTPEMVLDYGMKGAFVKLNDYLDDPGITPNFNAVTGDDKEVIMQSITMADGNIYALPKYDPQTSSETMTRMFVNKTWLDKLGLEVPKTTDDLFNVLLAFRDGDPNENGLNDEIGLYGRYSGGSGKNPITGIINSFIYYNHVQLSLDDQGENVVAPFTKDAFREALAYLRKLYDNGLLAASTFTDDDQQMIATQNNDPCIVGFTSFGTMAVWPEPATNENLQNFEIIEPLTGPEGVSYTPYNSPTARQCFFITSACKDPDAAIKFGDSFLNSEVSLVARFGEENVDWTRDSAILAKAYNPYVEAGIYDHISLVVLNEIYYGPTDKFWQEANPKYAPTELMDTIGTVYEEGEAKIPDYSIFNYEYYHDRHPQYLLPTLMYTLEEAQENAEPITNITDYVKQSIAEFCTGARDIDTEWDKYLQELDNMGLQTWISTAQAAYERTKS